MIKPQDIVRRIKEEKIKPIPKWRWLLKETLYWMALVFLIVFGSLVFSFLMLNLFDFHFGTREMAMHPTIGKYFLIFVRTMPLVWFFLAILLVFLSVMIFGKTKHGYRYQNLLVVSVVVLVVSIFAFGAHFLNFSRKIEDTFEGAVPRNFHKFMPSKEGRFFMPEEGFVAGRIIELGDEYFFIINFKGERWKILLPEKKDELKNIQLAEGTRVFAVGEKRGENIFQANEIRILEKERRGKMRKNQNLNQRSSYIF